MQAKRIPCSSHAWKGPRHYWNSFNQSKLPFGYPPRRYRRRGSLSRGTRRESFLLSGFIHSNPRPTTALHLSSQLLLSSSASFLRFTLFVFFLLPLFLSFFSGETFRHGAFCFFAKFSFPIVKTPFRVFISKIIPSFIRTVSRTIEVRQKSQSWRIYTCKIKTRNSKRFYEIYVCLIEKLF